MLLHVVYNHTISMITLVIGVDVEHLIAHNNYYEIVSKFRLWVTPLLGSHFYKVGLT